MDWASLTDSTANSEVFVAGLGGFPRWAQELGSCVEILEGKVWITKDCPPVLPDGIDDMFGYQDRQLFDGSRGYIVCTGKPEWQWPVQGEPAADHAANLLWNTNLALWLVGYNHTAEGTNIVYSGLTGRDHNMWARTRLPVGEGPVRLGLFDRDVAIEVRKLVAGLLHRDTHVTDYRRLYHGVTNLARGLLVERLNDVFERGFQHWRSIEALIVSPDEKTVGTRETCRRLGALVPVGAPLRTCHQRLRHGVAHLHPRWREGEAGKKYLRETEDLQIFIAELTCGIWRMLLADEDNLALLTDTALADFQKDLRVNSAAWARFRGVEKLHTLMEGVIDRLFLEEVPTGVPETLSMH